MTKALNHKGFSVIEACCDCPTLYGRMNRLGGPVEMMKAQKDHFVTREQAAKLSPEELATKTVIGEFVNRQDRPEYTEQYEKLIMKTGGAQNA